MKIGQLLERDFSKPIEEIIKVNNATSKRLHRANRICRHDRIKGTLPSSSKAMVDAKSTPD